MPGFHWMTGYGDYLRELAYACKRVGIEFENLTAWPDRRREHSGSRGHRAPALHP